MNCTVNFANNGVFQSGQEVTGCVQLYNENIRMLRAIMLKVSGFCSTSWTESSGFGDDKKSTTCSAREDYIKTSLILTGNGRDNQELLAGNHTFNFHFTLPQTIPSSLNHHYGKVLYQISVDIEQQLKFNYSFNFPFNVIGSLDLNHEGVEIRRPLRGDISKKFFLGFSTGALQISAQIPFCGFSGGQTLSIDVEIVNDSKINVERIFVELRQHLLFKCDFVSTRTDSKLLIQGSHDGVAASSKGQMSFLFQVPPVSPTSMKTCKYIHISYEAVIVAKFGGIHRSLELILPIVIGTIPLNRSSDLSENSPCLKEPSNENEKKD